MILELEDNSTRKMIRPWRTSSWLKVEFEFEKCLSYYEHDLSRVTQIRNAIKHAWKGYSKFAQNYDTLMPVSHSGQNDYGGISITAIDSLDTLWIANLRPEFEECRKLVSQVSFDTDTVVNLFETSIRALGGLMSAHFLTKDRTFKEKSVDLGERLVVGFSQHNIAKSDVNLRMRKASNPSWKYSSLSEAALSLEFYTLSTMITFF